MYQHLLHLLINSFSEALRNFVPIGHYSADLDGGLLDDLTDLNKPLSIALDLLALVGSNETNSRAGQKRR